MQYRNIIGSEIRKRRDGLGWSQDDLAARLQLAGWDIDRSQVSKIECRLVHVSDFQQLYLARVFKVSIDELYPRMKPQERVDDFLARAMPGERQSHAAREKAKR
jgi:transcriptional regulator with XRE-family HTH domain